MQVQTRCLLDRSRFGACSMIRARRGVAALEFALTAPVLIFMLLGMFDLSRAWMAQRQLATAAFSVGQIATILAVQSDNSNSLSSDNAWIAATAIYAAMPQTVPTSAVYSVSLAEVVFSNVNCRPPNPNIALGPSNPPAYCIGKVKWTANVLNNGLVGNDPSLARSCPTASANSDPNGPPNDGRLIIASDTQAPNLQSLTADSFTQAPVLVVDVTYTFKPMFLGSLIGTFPMRWMAAFGARSGNAPNMSDQVIALDYPVTGLNNVPPVVLHPFYYSQCP